MHFRQWKRREFITLLGGAAARGGRAAAGDDGGNDRGSGTPAGPSLRRAAQCDEGQRGGAGQTTAIPMTTTATAMAAARTTLPNTGHRIGLYVVTGPSLIGGTGGWGWIAGFIGASLASLWRLAYARAVRTTQIANAPDGQIFARRGAADTEHIYVGTSARDTFGNMRNYSVRSYFVRPPR
jgi:hypothetical protein